MDLERMKKEVQVDDGHILLGEPIELLKYGRDKHGRTDKKNKKTFIIRQLNWFFEWDKYTYNLAVFLMYYNQLIESSILPDNLEDLTTFRENIQTTMKTGGIVDNNSKNTAFKSMCEICKLSGVSIRWMKKNFTIDDWIEIFMYFYLYNTIGKKKGLKDVFAQIGIAQLSFHQVKAKYTSSLKRVTPSPN